MEFSDFYAGAGGWSLGMALAGHEAAMSAEIWRTANATRGFNLGRTEPKIDIRALSPSDVPDSPIIVGSPPCTQFSYANRGGGGDMADGLVDVRSFLTIVREKNPEFWVMENVPRLSGILRELLLPGGDLYEFVDLFDSIDDFDMSDWGVPQRRRRCIAGRYPREALMAMRGRRAPTLGEVLEGVRTGRDVVWNFSPEIVTDRDAGSLLTLEEARINAEKKTNHPIYNDMAFPDDQDRPSRTVTATCTKVSRESVVVPVGSGRYRLLSVREAAALQSFPLSYQFVSTGRSDRIKMAGNAIPPLFTYAMALAMKGESFPDLMPVFSPAGGLAPEPRPEPLERRPRRPGRPFRAAIASLRFKSAMAFELRNTDEGWSVVYHTGGVGSKTLRDDAFVKALEGHAFRVMVKAYDPAEISHAWEAADFGPEAANPNHPFHVADHLGEVAERMASTMPSDLAEAAVAAAYRSAGLDASRKALSNATMIAAGFAVATYFNSMIGQDRRIAA
jgi:DNA (cytosine-5)-methyltransferase 1